MRITSVQNTRIKNIVRLRQRRYRDRVCLTVVEGEREVRRALQGRTVPEEAYFCPALIPDSAIELVVDLQRLAKAGSTKLFEVTSEVFAKIAYRGESGGLLLVVPYLDLGLDALPVSDPAFLVVIEGVEKPGNLGAILRTADAVGVDGVILCNQDEGGTDVHNPNAVRASLGALFTVPIAADATKRVLPWLKARRIRIVAATPDAAVAHTNATLTGPLALVMGSEAHGLSQAWLTAADEQVSIPMRGILDSLNLAVATAVLLYEALRQRS
ncbi:MAG: TrmH family RNA methyltransferase [Anaerolineae bacterium]